MSKESAKPGQNTFIQILIHNYIHFECPTSCCVCELWRKPKHPENASVDMNRSNFHLNCSGHNLGLIFLK